MFYFLQNNQICDEISRTEFNNPQVDFLKWGLGYTEVLNTSKWFLDERLNNLSLVLPTDEPERVQGIMQYIEKRISRRVPIGYKRKENVHFLGHGGMLAVRCPGGP